MVYEELWLAALRAYAQGNVEIDPVLHRRECDRRRGLTLIVRPAPQVTERIAHVLSVLAAMEPEQHYYSPDELHVTALSLFTATPDSAAFFARLPEYLRAIDSALAGAQPVSLTFRGITASPSAVLIQGFDKNGALQAVRGRLREEFCRAGLADGLDRRYRISTAHVTVVRFREPLRDLAAFVARLKTLRDHDFGVMEAHSLLLVANDWYMSSNVVKEIQCYPLTGTADGGGDA